MPTKNTSGEKVLATDFIDEMMRSFMLNGNLSDENMRLSRYYLIHLIDSIRPGTELYQEQTRLLGLALSTFYSTCCNQQNLSAEGHWQELLLIANFVHSAAIPTKK